MKNAGSRPRTLSKIPSGRAISPRRSDEYERRVARERPSLSDTRTRCARRGVRGAARAFI